MIMGNLLPEIQSEISIGSARFHGKHQDILRRITLFLISEEGVRAGIVCATESYRKNAVEHVCNSLKEQNIEYSWHYGVAPWEKNSIVIKVGETEAIFSLTEDLTGGKANVWLDKEKESTETS
jgi:hypothetical protein